MGAGWRRFSEQVRGAEAVTRGRPPLGRAGGRAAARRSQGGLACAWRPAPPPCPALPCKQAKQKWHLGGERDFVATPNTRRAAQAAADQHPQALQLSPGGAARQPPTAAASHPLVAAPAPPRAGMR